MADESKVVPLWHLDCIEQAYTAPSALMVAPPLGVLKQVLERWDERGEGINGGSAYIPYKPSEELKEKEQLFLLACAQWDEDLEIKFTVWISPSEPVSTIKQSKYGLPIRMEKWTDTGLTLDQPRYICYVDYTGVKPTCKYRCRILPLSVLSYTDFTNRRRITPIVPDKEDEGHFEMILDMTGRAVWESSLG